MKKLLFSAYSLDLGGIEKALITLANKLKEKKYDVTIVLEKKQGVFLNELDKSIKVIEYTPSYSKNIVKRKIVNLYKRVLFLAKYKNRFDFSASVATYSLSGSFTARVASKNAYLWGHADYLTLFNNNKEQMKNFFKDLNYTKFKKIVFVSEEGRETFLRVFPEMKENTIVCNNLINDKKIKELANDDIEIKKDESVVTFLNVGRHEERQKKLSRIIDSASLLKKDNYKFKILFLGEGEDTEKYKEQVKENNLQDNILFLGKKQNPYPYFKISDCVILSSDYEGYPVVFLESFILNKPIITTNVSDYKQIEGKYGYVAKKDTKDIYEKMKKFINEGFDVKEEFDSDKYNEEILNKIENLF